MADGAGGGSSQQRKKPAALRLQDRILSACGRADARRPGERLRRAQFARALADLRALSGSITSEEKDALASLIDSLTVCQEVEISAAKPDGTIVKCQMPSSSKVNEVKTRLAELDGCCEGYQMMLFGPESEEPLCDDDPVGTLVDQQEGKEEQCASIQLIIVTPLLP